MKYYLAVYSQEGALRCLCSKSSLSQGRAACCNSDWTEHISCLLWNGDRAPLVQLCQVCGLGGAGAQDALEGPSIFCTN